MERGADDGKDDDAEADEGGSERAIEGGRERLTDHDDQDHHQKRAGQAGGLGEWCFDLAQGQVGERHAAEWPVPAGDLGQRERAGKQQAAPPIVGWGDGRGDPEVGGVGDEGDGIARRGEVVHPEHRRCEPRHPDGPQTPESLLGRAHREEPVDDRHADERKWPPPPGRDRAGKADAGDDAPDSDRQPLAREASVGADLGIGHASMS